MSVTPRPKTSAVKPRGKARSGAGTIQPRDTKTKGRVYDAWASVKDPRTGVTKRVPKAGFPSEAAAQQWINETMSSVQVVSLAREKAQMVPDIVREWMEATVEDRAASTHVTYKSNFNRNFPSKLNVRISALNRTRVKQFIREVGAASTRGDGRPDAKCAFNNLRSALDWAASEDIRLIKVNPIEGMKFTYKTQEKTRKPIPIEDAQKILHVSMGQVSHLIWRLCVETGARKGEITGLDVGDLDFRSPTEALFSVNKIATPESHGRKVEARTKTGGERDIHLTPELSQDLWNFTRDRSLKAPLFPSPTTRSASGRLGFDTLGRWWTRDCTAAGVHGRGYVPHMLRHTFATEMLGDGESVIVVSSMLGHSSPTTTYRFYAKATESQKKAATGRVRSLMSRPVAGNFAGKPTTQPSDSEEQAS